MSAINQHSLLKTVLAMKKFIFLCLIISAAFVCNAQDSNEQSKDKMHEMGLNVTQMFNTLAGGTSNPDLVGPYFITYKNIDAEGHAFRMGFGGKMERGNDFDSDRKVFSNGFDIRFGYEKQWQLAPKWLTYLGIDFLGAFNNLRTVNDFITTSSRDWMMGGGPVFGVQWMFSSQVGLSTETAFYYRHREFIDIVNVDASNPISNDDRARDNDLRFILPTALFLSVRF